MPSKAEKGSARNTVKEFMKKHKITLKELELIDRYLSGELTGDELQAFRNRMENEPDFRDKIREIQLTQLAIGESALEENLHTFHSTLTNEYLHKKNRLKLFRPWAIAASIILAVTVGWWFFSTKYNKTSQLYATYYEPDPGLMTTMGSPTNYEFEKAMVEYKNGEYQKAIKAWHQQLMAKPDNDTLIYFLGVAYQAIGTTDSARVYLSSIVEKTESRFYKDANWYLGLLYLETDKKEKAILLFKKSEYSKAEELLRQINK